MSFYSNLLGSAGVNQPVPTYEISRSVRFNSTDSAYLNRTPASTGNRKTWTWAGWLKLCTVGTNKTSLFGSGVSGVQTDIRILSSGYLNIGHNGGTIGRTDAILRDPSAWYHLVIAVDSTQATQADRIKIYINGENQLLSISSCPLNLDTEINNSAYIHKIGAYYDNDPNYFLNGYLADIHFIDGQALDPTSFGEFDANGIWQSKAYTGSYGTNGFRLDFADNSSAATLGTDTSGNGNDWTVNNLSPNDNVVQPQLYATDFIYTDPALVIANGTPLGDGSTFTNKYVFLVTNSGGDVGSKVFTANGAGDIGTNWTWLHYIGGSWTTTAGSYNNLSWELFEWGNQLTATFSIMNNGAVLHCLDTAAGAGPVKISGTMADFNERPNNAGSDSLVDVPTNGTETDTGVGGEVRGNYCTWDPLNFISNYAYLENSNLQAVFNVAASCTIAGNFYVSSGKWYWEVLMTVKPAGYYPIVGVVKSGYDFSANAGSFYLEASPLGYVYGADGHKGNNNSTSAYGASFTQGDILGFALDLDAGTITAYKNGVSQGVMYSGLSGSFAPAVSSYNMGGTNRYDINCGQRPFAYTAPSGFKALCTTNLPAPVVTKPSQYMDVKLYMGNGSTQTISGLEFSPDLVWIKNRAQADNHKLLDTVRGATEELESNTADAEVTNADGLTAFNSDGFDLGADAEYNTNTEAYVAWTWDAGNTTVTNTDGSITSQVRANASAGLSIVSYTGNATTGATFGHGLNVPPSLVIIKNIDSSVNWCVGHVSAGFTKFLELNTTLAATSASSLWNNTNPSSTVVTLGSDTLVNQSTKNHVAYCFAPVDGYATSFSYVGNGSADGVFQYLGFLPKLVLIKCSSTTGNWVLIDTEREGYNVDNDPLFPNLSNAEATTDLLDITSNGFKIRSTDADVNTNAATYVGFAWAESPFQYSRAR